MKLPHIHWFRWDSWNYEPGSGEITINYRCRCGTYRCRNGN